MGNSEGDGPDQRDIVSDSRNISLARDPQLGRDLVAQFDHVDSEQEAIKQAMRERVDWGRRGITPPELLETIQTFLEATSGQFHGETNGDGVVMVRCDVTGSEFELREVDDQDLGETVDVQVSFGTEDESED
ncbi:hypothetical protein [Natrinema versiforme]|uniref:Uncharacterized protein n=1 Tax=Natrinema versiforme JCM 10478 TaxID=1227496 RepID=L9Y7D8_9EURY|nr:hypothetical protein [Natrinema versiforme]ELY68853.1 hypothetical protein C489_05788 [Natrinema versiforme JCM 10478]